MTQPTTSTVHDLRSCLAVMRSTAEAQLLTAEGHSREGFAAIIEQVDRMSAILAGITDS